MLVTCDQIGLDVGVHQRRLMIALAAGWCNAG